MGFVVVLCILGSYGARGNMVDVIVTMVAGVAVRKYVGKVEHFLLAGREMEAFQRQLRHWHPPIGLFPQIPPRCMPGATARRSQRKTGFV